MSDEIVNTFFAEWSMSCIPHQDLHTAFTRLRDRLRATGASLTTEEAAVKTDDPAGQKLVSRLQWRLLSDEKITAAIAAAKVEVMSRQEIVLLKAWFNNQVEKLMQNSHFKTKSRGVLFQFACLESINEIALNPALADFLETEVQPLDLEQIINETLQKKG